MPLFLSWKPEGESAPTLQLFRRRRSITVSSNIYNEHFTCVSATNVIYSCEAISASDYVEFSNFMARDRKYSRHCGQLKEFDIESDRKFFRVTFRSNDRLDGTGFNATYHFMDEVETYTGRPSETSKGHQSIHGGYPYFSFLIQFFFVLFYTLANKFNKMMQESILIAVY